MNIKTKNSILFIIYALFIGALSGLVVWSFMKIMHIGINLIWGTIPSIVNIPFYTIIICSIGGLLIGIWKKFHGDYPESLETVIKTVKSEGKYPYHNLKSLSVSSMLPLIFGGSIGPEAGLSGIIAGLTTWVGDKFKYLYKEIKDLTTVGLSATLGTIFSSPMFGLIAPLEEEKTTLPKKSRIIVYFLAIFGAFGIFVLLNNIFDYKFGMPSFEKISIGLKECLWLIPLSMLGVASALFYYKSEKLTEKLSHILKKFPIIKGLIAGIMLGIIGTLLPLTMFSGEHEITEIMLNYQEIGAVILLLTGFIKLFITSVCLNFGFKGGHLFPCIASSISIGASTSIFLGIDPVFSSLIIASSHIAFILKLPLATILLLMILYPKEAIPVMLLGVFIGSIFSNIINKKSRVNF